MANTERKEVLDMLAAGKISAADAERLLSKLADSTDGAPESATSDNGTRPIRFLRVVIDTKDGDKVNVRVPLILLRTGIKLSAMVPALAGNKLKASGVDLSHPSSLSGDELIDELRNLEVNVDSTDGDMVRVFCE